MSSDCCRLLVSSTGVACWCRLLVSPPPRPVLRRARPASLHDEIRTHEILTDEIPANERVVASAQFITAVHTAVYTTAHTSVHNSVCAAVRAAVHTSVHTSSPFAPPFASPFTPVQVITASGRSPP